MFRSAEESRHPRPAEVQAPAPFPTSPDVAGPPAIARPSALTLASPATTTTSSGRRRTGTALSASQRSVANWCRRHVAGGDATVIARCRSRRPSEQRALLPQQELDLIAALREHLPDQLGLPGYLWTRRGVAQVIERSYQIQVTPRSIGRYLRWWGLGARKPTDRACTLCVVTVARWLEHEYPAVVGAARASGAQVCWIGRHRLSGVEPAAELISAVSTASRIRFMVSGYQPSAPLPVRFLERLIRHDARPVYAVVDGSWTSAEWPRRLPAGAVLHALPTCSRNPN